LAHYYIHQAKKSKVLKPSPGRDWLAKKFKMEQMEMPIYHGKRTAPDKSKKALERDEASMRESQPPKKA
jgi:hypothetical protein